LEYNPQTRQNFSNLLHYNDLIKSEDTPDFRQVVFDKVETSNIDLIRKHVGLVLLIFTFFYSSKDTG